MTTESSSSGTDQEDTTRCPDVITSDKMDDYLKTGKLMSIVLIKDRCNTPYILVGREDDPNSREWLRYRGETTEQISKYIEWRSKTKELQGRSMDDLNEFRLSIMALARIKNLLRLNDEDMFDLYDATIMATATSWYSSDIKQDLNYQELTDEQVNAIAPYVLLVKECVAQLFEIFSIVKSNSDGGECNANDNRTDSEGTAETDGQESNT